MKKIASVLGVLFLLAMAAVSCHKFSGNRSEQEQQKQDAEKSNTDVMQISDQLSEELDGYYYYGYEDKKIFLEKVTDKISLRFTNDVDKEQILALINEYSFLKLMNGALSYEGFIRYAALESKDGNQIPADVIESFKANPKIASVTYMYLFDGTSVQAIMDEFVVKLKASTSYAQLRELAKQNNCKIGEENKFVKNQFTLYVSKTSKLNAMQMANLFYEAKLFEFSEPNFMLLNGYGFRYDADGNIILDEFMGIRVIIDSDGYHMIIDSDGNRMPYNSELYRELREAAYLQSLNSDL